MKKTFLLLGAMALTGLMAPKASAQGYELRVLTFEDGTEHPTDFSAMAGLENYVTHWSDLIASSQYGDAMLYGESGMGESEQIYRWHDGGNTELSAEINEGYGSYAYWSGGEAISHYWTSDNSQYNDFNYQLTAYRPALGSDQVETVGGGHNGSNHFCVHFGYIDNQGWGLDHVQAISFGDGVARVIDHVYVCPINYTYACIVGGNELTAALGEDGIIWLEARGFEHANDAEPSEIVKFRLFDGQGTATLDWTKWDLSSLGAIEKLEFNMYGEGLGSDNGYGLSQPAYFAWDDMAVRFPVETPAEPTSYERTGLTAGNYGTICLPYDVAAADRTGATFFEAIGKTAEGLVLEEVSGTLTAGKAYFFQATATSLECTYSGDKVATPVSASLNNGLQGVYEDNTDVPNGMYFLNSNKLWQSSGSNKVDANRAYVDLNYVPNYVPAPVAGRRRVVMPCIPEETTALPSEVENETNVTKQMINGKLYIQKNGRMYDAQGKNIQ